MYIFIVHFERWCQVGFRLFCPQRIFKKASHNHSFTYRIHTQNSGRGNFVLQILLFSVCLLLNLLANKLRAKLRHSKRINEGQTRIYSICGTKLFVLKGQNSTFRSVLNGHILRFQSAFNRQPPCPDWTSNQQSADFWLHQQKKPDLCLKRSLRIHSNCGNELSVLKGQGLHSSYIAILQYVHFCADTKDTRRANSITWVGPWLIGWLGQPCVKFPS